MTTPLKIANGRISQLQAGDVIDSTYLPSSSGATEATFTAPPDPSTLTWVNQSTAAVATYSAPLTGFFLDAPATGTSNNLRVLVKSAPATPYSLVCRLVPMCGDFGSIEAGLVFRESATAKLIVLGYGNAGIGVFHYSSPTTFVATDFSPSRFISPMNWAKLNNDGTNLNFYIGPDGVNWLQVKQLSKTSYFTTGPDQVGVFCDPNISTATPGPHPGIGVLSWTLG